MQLKKKKKKLKFLKIVVCSIDLNNVKSLGVKERNWRKNLQIILFVEFPWRVYFRFT